jgi:Ca-activated chloride channel homolog
MQRRSSVVFSLVFCLSLLLAGCGGTASTTTTEAPQNQGSHTDSQRGNDTTDSQSPDTGMAPEAAPASGGATTDSHASEQSVEEAGATAPQPNENPETTSPDDPYPMHGSDSDDTPYDSTYFQNYGTNPFVEAEEDPLSTFAMDIDTASYGVMRRFLDDGYLPDPDSVRPEEYLNYFDYRYPQPEEGSNFAIYTEAAPSPFGGKGYEMVQIGIQGRAIADEGRRPTSLTFVIDVSGSMERENRLETVKESLTLLVEELRPDDTISIVVYGTEAESILSPTSGDDKRRILNAIDELEPSGSTNVEAGLDIGFEQADEAFVRGSNMVMLLSDGVANNGVTDPEALLEKYEHYTSRGIKLSTFGFGMGNYNDILMEQLADHGNGFYSYIDSVEEAERVFVENLTGTLQLIARDAKIQVEFNPEVVSRYRLVGYENRDIADRDFRDDDVDAGEVGAGHSVTALYEIKRYPDAEGDIGTVRIRYHRIGDQNVIEEAQTLASDDLHRSIEDSSSRFRLAVGVAEYAELLRHERWVEGDVLDRVVDLTRDAAYEFEDEAVDEFARLVNKAARLAPED